MKRVLTFAVLGIALVRELFTRRPPSIDASAGAPASSRIARFVVSHPWMTLLGLATAGLLGGFLVMVSGIVPIAASSGHWRITEILLHFSMRRSVATHSMAVGPPPDLDDPSLVLRGAGHYEGGCRPCHGGPRGDVPAISRAMTPKTPPLPDRIPTWEPDELFYIVKHGVKFTGMPAWPAQHRDDEVWAMVAFLRRLPSLSMEDYQALAGSVRTSIEEMPLGEPLDPRPPAVAEQVCARCHGLDGLGRGTGAFPKLAGQRAEYLFLSLRAYATGERHSGIMQPIAEALPVETQREIAAYYAALPGLGALGTIAADPARPGEALVRNGAPPRIPSCQDCHGPSAMPLNPAYPQLLGQYPEYLRGQLQLLKARRRGGTAYVRLMHAFASRLTDEEIARVVEYYSR